MIFRRFPYTNLNDINLDWIIKKVRKLSEDVAEINPERMEEVAQQAEAAEQTAQNALETAEGVSGIASDAETIARAAQTTANNAADSAQAAGTAAAAAQTTANQNRVALAIVANGNTAPQNISAGQYVIWYGGLYTASAAIASGATLSSSNLTAVTGGGLNHLMSSIGDYIGPFMKIPLFSGNTRANYNAIRLTLNGNNRGSIFVFCVNGNGTPYCFAVSYPNDLSTPTVTTVYGSATTATTDSINHTITIKLGYGYVFMALACNASEDGTWSYVNIS